MFYTRAPFCFLIAAQQRLHFGPTFRPSNKIQTFSQLLTAHCKTCRCCQTGFWSICFVCFAWFVSAGLFMFFSTAVILQSSLVLCLCWLHFHCRCFPGVCMHVCTVRRRDPFLLTFQLILRLKWSPCSNSGINFIWKQKNDSRADFSYFWLLLCFQIFSSVRSRPDFILCLCAAISHFDFVKSNVFRTLLSQYTALWSHNRIHVNTATFRTYRQP